MPMASTTTTLSDPPPPRHIDIPEWTLLGGRYEILREIGSGGMGTVYLAHDMRLARHVAVKVLRTESDAASRERFLREAQIMAGIRSTAIVQVHDFGEDNSNGAVYIVMDAHLLSRAAATEICGRKLHCPPPESIDALAGNGDRPMTLETVLENNRALDESTVASLGAEILESMRAIHSQGDGVIHRDIKPSNLIFAADGSMLLSDFGIAKSQSAEIQNLITLTLSGRGIGTVSYASPEQRAGREVTVASDFYSFGLVLYRMLTGGLPGTASTALPVDVAERVSRKWRPLLSSLLDPEPTKRITDYDRIAGVFAAISHGATFQRRSRIAINTAVIAIGIAMAIGAIVTIIDERRTENARGAATIEEPPQITAEDFEEFGRTCIAGYVGATNNLVRPKKGEVLRVGNGETALGVESIGWYALRVDFANGIHTGVTHEAKYSEEPSKIVLDGGRLLFARDLPEIKDLIYGFEESMAASLESHEKQGTPLEFKPIIDVMNAPIAKAMVDLKVPIEVTENGGVIEAFDNDVDYLSVYGPIKATGDSAEVKFSCCSTSVIEIWPDALASNVTISSGSRCKLVESIDGRKRVKEWIE